MDQVKIKDGKYTVYRIYEGEESKLGSFTVKDESISFPSEDDLYNIDLFQEGPMSDKAKNDLEKYLNKEHHHIRIKKS